MPAPYLTNRFNRWMSRQACGTCQCMGTCTWKVNGVSPIGEAHWCLESTDCESGCRCYCASYNAAGAVVPCPSDGFANPVGTIKTGLCLSCSTYAGGPGNAKCDGTLLCAGYCLFRSNGTLFEFWLQACSSVPPACACPSAPSHEEGVVVGEIRTKGPCTKP